MSTFFVAAALAIVAAITASIWLTLVLWIPGNLVSVCARDPESEYGIMVALTLTAATGVVFLFGALVLGLPWYAALTAGVLVGVTSYPRRNPAAPDAYFASMEASTERIQERRREQAAAHGRTLPCPHCGRYFKDERGLAAHVEAVHPD